MKFFNIKPLINVTSLPNYYFQSKSNIETIESDSIKQLGTLTIDTCRNIRHIFLPALTTLGPSCCQNSSALKYLKLGQLVKNNNLTSRQTFAGSPLVYVALYFTSIPSWVDDTSINNLFPNNPYIYVPDDFLDDLKITSAFSPMAERMKPLSELEADALAGGWDY